MRFFLLPLLFVAQLALGAGTVTVTRSDFTKYERVILDFVANSSGAADRTIGLQGRLVKALTNPGSPAPTANYDIYFYDAEDTALSLTGTILENRHTTTTEAVYPLVAGAGGTVTAVPPVAVGNYVFTVANAGSGGAGRVIIYLER